jgi:uncharacterized membrane protein YkvA (DUF1232 family)
VTKTGAFRAGRPRGRWGARIRDRGARLPEEVAALYLAVRHPMTPWYAKALAVVVVAYALSPIDLIPDFIPLAGYLDDIVIVPAGLALVARMIPRDVMEECRRRASPSGMRAVRWIRRLGLATVLVIWVAVALAIAALILLLVHAMGGSKA